MLLNSEGLSICAVSLVDTNEHIAACGELEERCVRLVAQRNHLDVAEPLDSVMVVSCIVRDGTKLLQEGSVVKIDECLRNVEVKLFLLHQVLVSLLTDGLRKINGIVIVDALAVAKDFGNLDKVVKV